MAQIVIVLGNHGSITGSGTFGIVLVEKENEIHTLESASKWIISLFLISETLDSEDAGTVIIKLEI